MNRKGSSSSFNSNYKERIQQTEGKTSLGSQNTEYTANGTFSSLLQCFSNGLIAWRTSDPAKCTAHNVCWGMAFLQPPTRPFHKPSEEHVHVCCRPYRHRHRKPALGSSSPPPELCELFHSPPSAGNMDPNQAGQDESKLWS